MFNGIQFLKEKWMTLAAIFFTCPYHLNNLIIAHPHTICAKLSSNQPSCFLRICFNPLKTRKPQNGYLTKTVKTQMKCQFCAAFHQGLHCLLTKDKIKLQRKNTFFWQLYNL